MTDENKNGVKDSDEFFIHRWSLLVGLVLGMAAFGVVAGVATWIKPEWAGGVAAVTGNVCKPVERKLSRCEKAWSCIEGGAAIQGTDISTCAEKLKE